MSDKQIGSSRTEISDIDNSPKLISDSIDHLSAFVALLSLEKTDEALESAPETELRCLRRILYGLDLKSSSANGGMMDRMDRIENDVAVVLMEALSS